jgi:hypothetical protein
MGGSLRFNTMLKRDSTHGLATVYEAIVEAFLLSSRIALPLAFDERMK